MMNSFSFCLSGELYLSFNPEITSQDKVFLVISFFPVQHFKYICHFLLACKVSAKTSTNSFMRFPLHVSICFSLAAFKILSWFLTFAILIIIYLSVDFFGLIFLWLSVLPGPECLFPSPRKGNFQPLFLQVSFLHLSLSSLSGTTMIQTLLCLKLSQNSFKLFSFLIFFSFFLVWLGDFCLPGHSSIFLYHLICYWFSLL